MQAKRNNNKYRTVGLYLKTFVCTEYLQSLQGIEGAYRNL